MEISPTYKKRVEILREFGEEPTSAKGRWRISDLRSRGIVTPISRTWCRIAQERRFVIEQGDREKELVRIARKIADTVCVWSIRELNPLVIHQRMRRLIFVEVEKGAMNRVFEEFLDQRFRNVYLETDTKWVMAHVGGSNYDVFVRQLVTRAPLEDVKKGIPSLEKIIVDLFEDGFVYGLSRSPDLAQLIRNAFTTYSIDIRTLRTYARRRGNYDHLSQFIEWLAVVPPEVLHDP
ncbi:MAG: hypothetical protein IPP80_04875 [Ignavibacteria bacterium]|nr:hypothetical protein [Ignavibacteria bacterium]